MRNTEGPENPTEVRAFGSSVLLGSIICNRETVGKKTCAIKKVAACAFEVVNDSVSGAPTRAAAASGAGMAASSGSPIYQKLGGSNDKDNRHILFC